MKILLCYPEFFEVSYSINPWMNLENKVNPVLAKMQWADLVYILTEAGAETKFDESMQKPNLPDIVFTANAGVINNDKKIILSNFKHVERRPEKDIFKKWFENQGYECLELPEGYFFEGAGDVLARHDKKEIYFGYGFRTDEKILDLNIWKEFYSGYQIRKIKLVDPYFYHLDTCFCPLPDDYALIYPNAFEEKTIEELANSGLKLLKVPEMEAKKFACNAVCVVDSFTSDIFQYVRKNVVIPSGCPETRNLLESAGFKVFDTDMSEYIKSGGACKCLTLKMDTLQ